MIGGKLETNVQVSSTSDSSTPGNTTLIEAKIDAQVSHITQLIDECVISCTVVQAKAWG